MELKDVFVVPDDKTTLLQPNGRTDLEVAKERQNGPVEGIPCNRQMSIQSTASSNSSLLRSERGHHRDRRRERLNTELLVASAAGDLATVKRLSEEGASVNATCRRSQQSALHAAAAKGQDDVLDYLMKHGANPQARDAMGRQPVHLAAWNGHMNTLATFSQVDKALLSSPILRQENSPSDGDLDSWNHKHDNITDHPLDFPDGSTPLHLVCKKSNMTCVNFLLHMGVPVDVKDSRGLTPLDTLGSNDDELVGLSFGGTTPAGTPSSTLGAIEEEPGFTGVSFDSIRLPSKMSKIFFTDDKKIHPPAIGTDPRKSDSSTKNNLVTLIAKSLLEKGAKMPSSQYKEGYVRNQSRTQMTALHTAVEDNNVELVKLLLQQNGCMLSWNEKGETPLHVAVKNSYTEPLIAMLMFRENPSEVIDVRDSKGRTLLHIAVMRGWADGVSLLLENGADVKTSSNAKNNVFHLAAERGDVKMLEELLSVADSVKVLDDRDNDYYTPLCRAVGEGYLECAKLLVSSGADPSIILPGDRTLLHLCAENDFHSLLNYFVTETSAVEKMNTRCQSVRGGITPLQSAALLGFSRSVDVLIRAGCDVTVESTDEPHLNSTALHIAARSGHDTVVSSILTCDRNVLRCTDSRGWYPLHLAASSGHSRCVASMLEFGADLSDYIVDEKGSYLTGLQIIMYCIPQPLEFLVETFDSYIRVNEYPITHPNCEIKVNFDILIPNKETCKQLRVLTAMLNCGNERVQEKLLLHPIVETFLHLKWRKLRLFFFIIMFVYMMFSISLTALAVWYYILKNETSIEIHVIQGLLFATLLPIVMTETLNVIQLQRYYLLDYESWVKWIVFGCSLVVGLADPSQWWARHLTAITVLLAWIELLFLVARCPNWGFYVLMFSRVAIKVIKVLITFTFLLMGFTFAFMIQFDGKEPFSTVWQSTVKVFVMMFEFDYEATFEGLGDSDWLSFISRAMFLFFVVLVAIVLMNLMVGLAVSDITVLETQGRTQRLAKQVSFLSLLEVMVGSEWLLDRLPDRMRVWAENRRSVMPEIVLKAGGASLDCGGTCLPRKLRASITEKVASTLQNRDGEADASLKNVISRLDKVERRESSSIRKKDVTRLEDLLGQQMAAIQQLQIQLGQLLQSSDRQQPSPMRPLWSAPQAKGDGFAVV